MEPTQLLTFVRLDGIPLALVAIVVIVASIRFLARFLDALGERMPSRRLLFKQIGAFARFLLVIGVTAFSISSVFVLSQEVLLAVGGSAAVAVGFAFKDLLASLMAGLILLFDRPFQVGDRIAFDGEYGEVVEIGLRTVRVATLDDNLISIPNNRFLNDAVSCANAGALDQMCVFHFYIGCNENFELASALVYEAAASSRYVYLDKAIAIVVREGPVPQGAERFAIKVTVKCYVLDGRYETALGTDITERVIRAFRKHGVRTAGALEWGHHHDVHFLPAEAPGSAG